MLFVPRTARLLAFLALGCGVAAASPGCVPEDESPVEDGAEELGDGDLPCVIDAEQNPPNVSAAVYADNIRTWMDIVEAGTGKQPIIYTGSYYWDERLATSEFNDHPLWIAHYTTNCPRVPESWEGDWTFWQYTSTGGIPGIPGDVDKNWFRGTEEDLLAFAGGGTGSYAATLVDVEVPTSVLAGETFDVTIRFTNSGTAPWDASTFLGTSEPRDRASAFADASWVNDHRVIAVSGEVAAGAEHAFEITLRAPDAPGAYVEHFALVQEGATWFADAGGPADDAVRLAIQVLDPGGSGSAGGGSSGQGSGVGGSPGEDDGDSSAAAGIFSGGAGGEDAGGEDGADDDDGDSAALEGDGCSASPSAAGAGSSGLVAILLGAVALMARGAGHRRRH